MPGGVGGRLDQRPTQVLGPVLGQRAAVVLAAGLVDPRTQPGVAGQFGRAGEAGEVADLGGCSPRPSRSRGWSSTAARGGGRHPAAAELAHTRRPGGRARRSDTRRRWCRRPRVRAAPAGAAVVGRRRRTGPTPGTGGRTRAGWRGCGSSARCCDGPGAAATGRVPARRAPSGCAARSPAPGPGARVRPAPMSRSCRSCRPAGPALDLLGVGDLHLPARQLQLVVHEPGPVHRLDRRVHPAAEPADPVGQHRQPAPVRHRRGHRQRCSRLVHHVNIKSCSTQVQPDVHHHNRPPSDTLFGQHPASVPPGAGPRLHDIQFGCLGVAVIRKSR